MVEVSDLTSRYRASHHPDVKSGKKTENEVFREFLRVFDGCDQDGKVTLQEFEVIELYAFFRITMRIWVQPLIQIVISS